MCSSRHVKRADLRVLLWFSTSERESLLHRKVQKISLPSEEQQKRIPLRMLATGLLFSDSLRVEFTPGRFSSRCCCSSCIEDDSHKDQRRSSPYTMVPSIQPRPYKASSFKMTASVGDVDSTRDFAMMNSQKCSSARLRINTGDY